MKNLFLLIGLLFNLTLVYCQQFTYLGASDNSSTPAWNIVDLAVDGNNRKIVVGSFYTQAIHDFDPSVATSSFSNPDVIGSAGFVAAYSASGALDFVFQITDTDISMINVNVVNIDIDAENNIYIKGSFTGKADFDPSESIFELQSSTVFTPLGFLASYTSNGEFRFALPLGDLGGVALLWEKQLRVDNNGNSYIAINNLVNGFDYDPGAGVFLADTLPQQMISYDTNGNFRFGYPISEDVAFDITPDGRQYLFSRLLFGDSYHDFDPGVDEVKFQSDSTTFVLSSYSFNGDFLFANGMRGTANVVELVARPKKDNIVIAPDGSIYIAALLGGEGSVDLDPGNGDFTFTVNNFEIDFADIFITKYSAEGDFLAARHFEDEVGAVSFENVIDLEFGSDGNLILVGAMSGGLIDFGSNETPFLVSSISERALLVGSFDQDLTTRFVYTVDDFDVELISLAISENCPQFTIAGSINRNEVYFFANEPESFSINTESENTEHIFLLTVNTSIDITPDCQLVTNDTEPKIEENKTVTVYPNPVSSTLFFRSDQYEVISVQLYDASGRLLLQKKGIQHFSINMADLPRGTYVVRVNQKEFTKSILILR